MKFKTGAIWEFLPYHYAFVPTLKVNSHKMT